MTMEQTKPMSEPMTEEQIILSTAGILPQFTPDGKGHWNIEQVRQALRLAREPQWVSVKPELSCECILLTASRVQDEWSVGSFHVLRVEYEDQWYWGIHNEFGDEWGAYEDLEAECYSIISLPKPPSA